MEGADGFWPTLRAVGGIFAGGAVLVLGIGRFHLRRVLRGELGARYLGWLILTPIYLVAVFSPGIVGVGLLALGIGLALVEYGHAARLGRGDLLLLGALALVTLATALWLPLLFGPLPALVLLLLTLLPILTGTPEALLGRVRLLSWGYLYVIWALAHALPLVRLPGGRGAMVLVIAGCGLADIGAYCIGKAIGRTPIAPTISPNKCWEGLLGNLLGASLALWLFHFGLPTMESVALLSLVFLIAIGSAWGDLVSSLAKRLAGIKDWGYLIPGHGGLLDRLNSLIVVLPLTYYYLALVLGTG